MRPDEVAFGGYVFATNPMNTRWLPQERKGERAAVNRVSLVASVINFLSCELFYANWIRRFTGGRQQ